MYKFGTIAAIALTTSSALGLRSPQAGPCSSLTPAQQQIRVILSEYKNDADDVDLDEARADLQQVANATCRDLIVAGECAQFDDDEFIYYAMWLHNVDTSMRMVRTALDKYEECYADEN